MKLWKECLELHDRGETFVVVTLTSARGSTPQDPGAKILVTRSGLYAGTIGGGKVEMAAISKALGMLEHHTELPPELVVWNLQKDIGMSCGGEVSFLFEHFFLKQWPIVIFGAGHVAQALTRILCKLNCSVTCVDSREEWLLKLEGVKTIHHPYPEKVVSTFSPRSYFICMTMGHAYDVPILMEIAKHAPNSPYVGVIGSDIKGMKIRNELLSFGLDSLFVDRLKVPIGLPIGTNHPYEIAISISAELLQTRGT